jgi:hypothetical protein
MARDVKLLITKYDHNIHKSRKGSKVILATSPGGIETSSIPHFLDNRPTDGDEVVSLKRRPRFTLRKIFWG